MQRKNGKKVLIISAAALGYDFLCSRGHEKWGGFEFQAAETVFPAVTCTVQASFRTASPPSSHGMVANGLYFRDVRKPMFWEQSSGLIEGARFWGPFREAGNRAGMLFWQQSMGEAVDVLLTPAPVHKHGGGMIQDCYCRPENLYANLCASGGKKFNLMHYWGPMASIKAGEWISSATATVLRDAAIAPDICMVYLPTLDYDLQRHGPESEKAGKAIEALLEQMDWITGAARANGYEILIFGDYSIAPVSGETVFPNRALAEAGLLKTRRIGKMLYPDLHTSSAFAVADHEVAHVYISDLDEIEHVRRVLSEIEGIEEVLDQEKIRDLGLNHPNSGELVIVAGEGRWIAYPWWNSKSEAPDFAAHVDIHNKPGYDPCELFFGWPPWKVSQDTSRIRGTHGKAGEKRQIAWASSFDMMLKPETIIDLAKGVRDYIES